MGREAGRNNKGEKEMHSTHETKIKNTETPSCEVTEKRVREVVVNYRGRRRDSFLIDSPVVSAHHIRGLLPDNSREHFVALYLDSANKVIGFAVVATGTATTCLAHPREVFQRAVLLGAVSLVIGHNHPSGSPSPSTEDDKVTRVMKEGGGILGIKLLDHVIVTATQHYSFSEAGAL